MQQLMTVYSYSYDEDEKWLKRGMRVAQNM